MIGQITPLVKVASARIWARAAAAHMAGAFVSASLLGLLLGASGHVAGLHSNQQASTVLLSGLLFVCAVEDLYVTWWHLPSLKRQTPSTFQCAFGPTWGAFAWGLDLGQGWTTSIHFFGLYSVAAWAFLSAEPVLGAIAMAAYGVGRALPVMVAGILEVSRRPTSLVSSCATRRSHIVRANALMLCAVSSFLLVSLR